MNPGTGLGRSKGLTPSALRRTGRLEPGKPLTRNVALERVPLRPARLPLTAGNGKSAATRRSGTASGSGESFPPDVAALIDARDLWCVHCGSPFGLQRHHRRIKGTGGDSRPHTDCACNGVRLCILCHIPWAHTEGRREAEAEGLIIPRATLEPWTESVLVRTADGGLRKYPSCTGEWLDMVPGRDAA